MTASSRADGAFVGPSGCKRWQPVASGRRRNPRNRGKPLLWVAPGCRRNAMVRRRSTVTGAHLGARLIGDTRNPSDPADSRESPPWSSKPVKPQSRFWLKARLTRGSPRVTPSSCHWCHRQGHCLRLPWRGSSRRTATSALPTYRRKRHRHGIASPLVAGLTARPPSRRCRGKPLC
jgi:hypothetical protein